MINFVRNIGGSVFIAITGAVVTNRSLYHEAHLQQNMTSLYIPYNQYSQGLDLPWRSMLEARTVLPWLPAAST